MFVVVVDRARPIRCIGSGLAAVCPARFLITPTTVVLRSSRGDTKPRSGILNGRQFTGLPDRLASNKSRTSRRFPRSQIRIRVCPVSRQTGKFIFFAPSPPPPPPPPRGEFVLLLEQFLFNCGRLKDCPGNEGSMLLYIRWLLFIGMFIGFYRFVLRTSILVYGNIFRYDILIFLRFRRIFGKFSIGSI